ncbi:MAG: hypothetical protein HKN58_02745 [Xanthomonadales bacterium]|nr:hypothetical protein [Xanthomonadales bacterium]
MTPSSPLRLALSAAVSIAILVAVFLPSEIYVRNPMEFVSTAGQLIGILLGAALALALALAGPVLIPSSGWRSAYARLLAALFIGLWISGSFLVSDFGIQDGGSFDPARHAHSLAWHSVVFIWIVTAAFLVVTRWPRGFQTAIGIIAAGLLVLSAYHFYLASNDQDQSWTPVEPAEVSRFSQRGNLLIVLMDSFQSDALPEILADQSELGDALDGFTYYPDTLGVAPSTYLTMPAIHSGRQYNNLVTVSEFYDIGVKSGSFFNQLADQGYQVDLVNPITGECPEQTNVCHRQENLLLQLGEVTLSESLRLLDLGVFRVAPGLPKKWLFEGATGPLTRLAGTVSLSGLELRIFQGNKVLDLMAENLSADEGRPTARLVHLFNTHPPYMFDKNCRFTGVARKMDRLRMISQTKCGLAHFVQLLESLKTHEVYDNTMIVLTADTGVGNIYADDDLSSTFASQHGVTPGQRGRLIGGANPVLAIKYPGDRGAIRTVQLQAQLTDIPATVCATLADCQVERGLDLAQEPDQPRQRVYHYYQWKHEYWGMNHIPGLTRFVINGPLWKSGSWSRAIAANLPTRVVSLDFSAQDPPEVFGLGWGEVETNAQGVSKRWAVDRRAELDIPLPQSQDLRLRFQVMAPPSLDAQQMTVYLDGRPLGARAIEASLQHVTIPVPADMVTGPVSRLEFEFSQITTPDEGDSRRVSVSFFQLDVLVPGQDCTGSPPEADEASQSAADGSNTGGDALP